MTTKMIATDALQQSAGREDHKEILELIEAYAEARHIGGCHTYNAKTAEARAKVVAALTAAPQGGAYAEPTYLCKAWGETDLPAAAIVRGLDGIRAFLAEQWLGDADAEDYAGEKTLPAVIAEMQEDWEREGQAWEWSSEFEIGGISVQRVDDVGASHGQAPAGATDWWRKRADEIEAQVAATGSQEAMRCYTDMRTLLQAATAQPAPAATPQADSQPAPVRDYLPLPDFDTIEQHIYGACRRFITQDMLGPIHNLIRDAIDADRAARAPADSGAAPAGGETYHLGACIVDGVLSATVMRKEPGRSGAVTVLLSEQIPVEQLQDRDVIVDAAPPAPADSVLEDAARYRHLRDCNSGSLAVMQITGTGEDDWHILTEDAADAAIDAARKQGGAT